jgi:hypothetical protein
VKADDKTVAKVRRELERRSEIPNVETITDTKGRQQPTRKTRRTPPFDVLGQSSWPLPGATCCDLVFAAVALYLQ